MNGEKKLEVSIFKIIEIFIFLYFLRLFDFPDVWTIIISSFVITVFMIKQNKIRVDLQTCLLTLTVVLYFVADCGPKKAVVSTLTYIMPLLFIMANYIGQEIKRTSSTERYFERVIFAMILGITVHGLLNSAMFFYEKQFTDQAFWMWDDIWSGDILYTTQHVAYFLLANAALLPSVLYLKKRKIRSIFIIVAVFVFLYTSLSALSRVSTFLIPITFLIESIVLVYLEKEKILKRLNKRSMIIIAVFVLLSIISVLLLLRSSLGSSFVDILGRNGGIFHNTRFVVQRGVLQQLFVYPLGGRQMELGELPHAHNAWLDIADAAGVLPFFSFSLYTFIALYETVLLLKGKYSISLRLKILVLGIYFVHFVYFTVEPALESYNHFLAPWIFTNGLVHGYIKHYDLKEWENKPNE